jgi:hypothetical protein
LREFRAEKIGRDGFTFLRGGRGQSVENTRQVGALRKKGEAEPAEGNPWGPSFRHLRRSEGKDGRDMEREETAPNVRRTKTWKVRKLRRARSPFLPEEGGRAGGCR